MIRKLTFWCLPQFWCKNKCILTLDLQMTLTCSSNVASHTALALMISFVAVV